jgi:2-polyprenyl-3-methyl-5-hydroxy-6-metoxy-1,4-benzoquinol methylase
MNDQREQYWRERFRDAVTSARQEGQANIYSEHGWRVRRRVFDAVFARFRREGWVNAGMTAADFGCGTGAYVRFLAEQGLRATGMDLCREMVVHARDKSPDGLGWLNANCAALPFGAAVFDVTVSIGVLQHLTKPEIFLREAARVQKPGGTLFLMTLNRFTVLQFLRWLLPGARAADDPETATVRLRRYGVWELKQMARRLFPGCRTRAFPVFVFPRGFRWLEPLLTQVPGLRILAFPLAVSFLLCITLPRRNLNYS